MTWQGLPMAPWLRPCTCTAVPWPCEESSPARRLRPRGRGSRSRSPAVPATQPRVLSRPVNQRTGSPQLSGEHAADRRREPRRPRPHDRAPLTATRHPAATPGNSTLSTRPPQTTPPRGSSPRGGLDRCLQRAGSPVGSWKRTLGPPTMSTHPAAALPLTRRRRRSRWMLGPGCSRRA